MDICKDNESTKLTLTQSYMLDLPSDLLLYIFDYLNHHSLHCMELLCTNFRKLILEKRIWEYHTCSSIEARYIIHEGTSFIDRSFQWKRLGCLARYKGDQRESLLRDVISCSSIDRESESPSNTLTFSTCWCIMRHYSQDELSEFHRRFSLLAPQLFPVNLVPTNAQVAQAQCGCENGFACYWSSAPSTTKDVVDFIDYTTDENIIISQMQVIPYRAYWQPHEPSYAPQQVSFTFFVSEIQTSTDISTSVHRNRQLHPIYDSPTYDLQNNMILYQFQMPKRIWLGRGGVIRINLHGRQQADTLSTMIRLRDRQEQFTLYYTCLSFVGAIGRKFDIPEGNANSRILS